jgi:hypothetical protein
MVADGPGRILTVTGLHGFDPQRMQAEPGNDAASRQNGGEQHVTRDDEGARRHEATAEALRHLGPTDG